MAGAEYSNLLAFQRKLQAAKQQMPAKEMQMAQTIGQMAVRIVKQITPVDSGDLRASWDYDVLQKNGKWQVRLYNPMDYALYVDKGHRIVTRAGVTVGWQEGVFMIRFTEDEMKSIIPEMVKDAMEEVLRDLS